MGSLPDGAYAAALASVPGVGPRRLRTWLDGTSPWEAWDRLRAGRLGARFRSAAGAVEPAAVWERHRRAGIDVLLRGRPPYPDTLAGDAEAPAVLFALGDPGFVDRSPHVALVGTRTPTRYGLGLAAQLGGELAGAGIVVVSGLALGIDGAAHEGAMAAVGSAAPGVAPPLAVVAGGLDRPYPRRHALLWRRVAEAGAVVSEAPVGTADLGWRFPQRNRIIAALADVVVVVECHATGGSLHTVRAATRRGVPVGAVPGSVRSPASAGTNDLLADGCFVVRDVTDVLVAVGLARPAGSAPRPPDRRAGPPAASPAASMAQSRAGCPASSGVAPATPPGAGRPVPTLFDPRPLPAATGPGAPAPDGVLSAQDLTGARVLAALEWEPCHLDDLLDRTGLSLPDASAALERLRLAGRARAEGGWWERC